VVAIGRNPSATKAEDEDATIQYKASKNCYDVVLSDQLLSMQLDRCKTENRPGWVEKCDRFLQRYSTYAQRLVEKKVACPGTLREVAAQYFHSLVAAARNGSIDAQYCLIDNTLNDYVDAQEMSESYETSDLVRWARDAVTRGDWRIIEYLANDPAGHKNLLAALPDGQYSNTTSQYSAYRLRQLLLRGADGEYANQLKSLLTPNLELPPAIRDEAFGLTTADEEAANRWANEMFDRYFSTSPVQVRPQKICSYPNVEAGFEFQ
jgi:hypothetical protein